MNLGCRGSWETGRAPCHTHQGPPCLRACGKPPAQACEAAVPHLQPPSVNPPGTAAGEGLCFLHLKASRKQPRGHIQPGWWVKWAPGSSGHFFDLILPFNPPLRAPTTPAAPHSPSPVIAVHQARLVPSLMDLTAAPCAELGFGFPTPRFSCTVCCKARAGAG